MTKRLLECGASEPYHRLSKVAKASKLRKQMAKTSGSSAEEEPDSAEDSMNGDDDSQNEDRAQEKRFNMLKNTPLLWATLKGHLGVVWLLLVDGYSPNDLDDIDNNMIHLAAASGYHKILRVAIDDGGNIWSTNIYHNFPIHLSHNKEVHDILFAAQEESPAPLSDKEVIAKHEKNVQRVCYCIDCYNCVLYICFIVW